MSFWNQSAAEETHSEALAADIRARQFRACIKLAPLTTSVNCAFALFAGWAFRPIADDLWLAIAVGAVFFL
ncbi:MAG: hypothetical protein ACRDAM_07560, partial [Casimicrobium sp.]